MEIYILIVSFILFASTVTVGFLVSKIVKQTNEIERQKQYIKMAKNKINHARYGDFQTKFDFKTDKLGLYKSLNALFESITDRDLTISEYREKEKENYNLKEEFIAALTHDLKVPIIAQDKTYTLLLKEKFGPLESVQRDVILKLQESNADLKEMVNSILDIYKIENTGIQPNFDTDVNVNEFVLSCVDTFKTLGKSTGKEINFYPKEENIKADFDKLLIKRVLNNLIINAVNHSNSTDKIDIYLSKTGDTFSVDVVDYGDGIDEAEIKNIFKKYYSIANKTTSVTSGLGLYLSNKIVKKHKGVIEVESKKNQGSIFRVILPVRQDYKCIL